MFRLYIFKECLFKYVWPCDKLLTCPGFHPDFVLQQLGEAECREELVMEMHAWKWHVKCLVNEARIRWFLGE